MYCKVLFIKLVAFVLCPWPLNVIEGTRKRHQRPKTWICLQIYLVQYPMGSDTRCMALLTLSVRRVHGCVQLSCTCPSLEYICRSWPRLVGFIQRWLTVLRRAKNFGCYRKASISMVLFWAMSRVLAPRGRKNQLLGCCLSSPAQPRF